MILMIDCFCADCFRYMDFICLMTYDLHGSWESVTGLHAGLYASNNDPDKTLNVVSIDVLFVHELHMINMHNR